MSQDNLNPYSAVIKALGERRIEARFQSPDQLVVSLQKGPVWPNAGNSFWISHQNNQWYLCTWVPHCYSVPEATDVVELCSAFVTRGETAQYTVPVDLIERFKLMELDYLEADLLFGFET